MTRFIFFPPIPLILDPVRDERLLNLQIWINRIEVLGRAGLVFPIGMVPIKNLDALPQRSKLFLYRRLVRWFR